MITKEELMKIQILHQQGMSQRGIAAICASFSVFAEAVFMRQIITKSAT